MTNSERLREMAKIEREIAARIRRQEPHYFQDDNPAAWNACRGAEMRANALESMAETWSPEDAEQTVIP